MDQQANGWMDGLTTKITNINGIFPKVLEIWECRLELLSFTSVIFQKKNRFSATFYQFSSGSSFSNISRNSANFRSILDFQRFFTDFLINSLSNISRVSENFRSTLNFQQFFDRSFSISSFTNIPQNSANFRWKPIFINF